MKTTVTITDRASTITLVPETAMETSLLKGLQSDFRQGQLDFHVSIPGYVNDIRLNVKLTKRETPIGPE